MKAFQFVVALSVIAAAPASAQLAAPQQPTEKLLVLPLSAATADSAASIQLADGVRDRLTSLTKGKVMVVPKAKLCEALKASGFPCDILLDDQQARQLARFLQVNAYLTGSLERNSPQVVANVRLIDISSSGMTAAFTASNPNATTPSALVEPIAQRVASVVRTSEFVRQCNQERQKSQFARARAAAQRALAVDSNSTGAYLCIATIYEAQRQPVDSVIAVSRLALKGDSLNSTALENIARGLQQKGDTLGALEVFITQLRGEPRNTQKRLGIAQLLRQMKQHQRAVEVLDEGLKISSGDAQLIELKTTICIEGSLWHCAVEGMLAKAQHDSSALSDTTFLKAAIGATQSLPDSDATFKSQALLTLTAAAVQRFPNNASFLRARAAGFDLVSKPESSQVYLRKALSLDPKDVSTSLSIAKSIIDRAPFDTAQYRIARERKDSVSLRQMQQTLAVHIDSAKSYLRPGLTSTDSTQRLAAAVIMLTAGSKLAQAAAYDRAYPWLDTLLITVAPRSRADTVGPRQQVYVNGSFWYGLSSTLTLGGPYQAMTKAPKATRCRDARDVFERLTRTKTALQVGRRVHPPTADQMLGFVGQYEKAKDQVQKAFKCSPPLS